MVVEYLVIVKNILALDAYFKNNNLPFFDALQEKLADTLSEFNPSLEKISFSKSKIFVKTKNKSEEIRLEILNLISDMLGQNSAVVNLASIAADGWHEAQKERAERENQEINTDSNNDDNNTKTKDNYDIIKTELDKIKRIKEGLLKSVKGQNYAIDKVAESVFESDIFSANNEHRTTPLATFLFAGPSGVGKTFLAKKYAELSEKAMMTVDMSAGVDFKAVNKFVSANKDGIIVFDEFEKASPDVVLLFLQILDEARFMDIDFKGNTLILTTNAGQSLYDDPTRRNLSLTPQKVIVEALIQENFPECIVTRFSSGNIILFNHLEPYALMDIIADEIENYIKIFKQSFNINIDIDINQIAATVLYSSGGVSNARTLCGAARKLVSNEVQSVLSQAHIHGNDKIGSIAFSVDTVGAEKDVVNLYSAEESTITLIFSDRMSDGIEESIENQNHKFIVTSSVESFKKSIRGIVDYIIIDPFCGLEQEERIACDIEDRKSAGIDLIFYALEIYPDIPVYILNSGEKREEYATLISKGCKGVVDYSDSNIEKFKNELKMLSFQSLVNNASYRLNRSNKVLRYNCAQYIDSENALISFEKLKLKQAPASADSNAIFMGDKENGEKFKDVVGCKAAKEAMKDICDCIKNQREYVLSGKKIPKGIILYGKPGTGKTMLARALANEIDAAFIPSSGTAFYDKWLGNTEKNIRELFARARKYAPAVIFIDEVDAIAKMRTGDSAGRFQEDALTTFLAEMEGFQKDESRPVFVVVATNYSIDGSDGPALDPAFVRRFDSKIYFDYPDTDDRLELFDRLLAKHNISFGENHKAVLRNIATRTGGMNNADITTVVDCYFRSNFGKEFTASALMEAIDNFRFGAIKNIDAQSVKQTAYHEAGHALTYRILADTPSFLTIVSRGNFGGYMEHANDAEKTRFTYAELLNRICVSLAGRASEMLVYGKEAGNNTGASSDIESARNTLTAALKNYAMGEKLYEEITPEECEEIMQNQFKRATELLKENRAVLDELVELLIAEKSVDKTTLDSFFNSKTLIS